MASIFDFFGGGQQQQQQSPFMSLLGGQQPQQPQQAGIGTRIGEAAQGFGTLEVDPNTGALRRIPGDTSSRDRRLAREQQAAQFAQTLAQREAKEKQRISESSKRFGLQSERFDFEKIQAQRQLQRDQDTAMFASLLAGIGGGGGAGGNVVQPSAPLGNQSILGQPGTSGAF